ncbi:methyltransferase domain-containing protein [Nemania diffusa]|nr:methyltransferase domain-containing protein [Nemania diffusa]
MARQIGQDGRCIDFFPPTYSCPWDVRRLGHLGDGGKWICGMSKYESEVSRPIIVYSFGIGNDSSFEADLLASTTAQVFAFDYTTDNFGPEISSANNNRTSFERLALGGEDGRRDNNVEYQTLTSIMRRLGHDYVDIIKMDIEGDEFPALTTLMDEYADKELPIGQL